MKLQSLAKPLVAGLLNLSLLGSLVPMSAHAEDQNFAAAVSEVKYLLANNQITAQDAVATFSSKILKLEDNKVDVLKEAKLYSMMNAKSSKEMDQIAAQFDNGQKQIDMINAKAKEQANALSNGDDIDEVKVAAIMKNARTRIRFVSASLMQSVLQSTTGAHFLGCSEINAKMWVGIGVIVLGAAVTAVGLSKALLTEKGIIRQHKRASDRVNRKMDKQDAIIVETVERLTKEKAQLDIDIAYVQGLKDQGIEYYTDSKGNYLNVNDKLAALQTDLYWNTEEFGNIDHYWWEDNTDRMYQLQDVQDDQINDIENLSRTNQIGYVLTGAGAAIMTAGVVTGNLGLKQCK
ncbi:MAG: hypothetical protein ACOYL6_10005 [Bacteriovoracaceae bacterium]